MRRIHLIFALVLPWLLFSDTPWNRFEPDWPELVGRRLIAGDVILAGYKDSLWANGASLTSLPEHRFGHAGVVIVTAYGLRIVHASGNPGNSNKATMADTLPHFLVGARRIGVYRPRRGQLGQQMAVAATELGSRGLPFDSDFSLASVDRLYCTELIWRVMMAASQRDPFPRKPVILSRPVITLAQVETAPQLRLAFWLDMDQAKQPELRANG